MRRFKYKTPNLNLSFGNGVVNKDPVLIVQVSVHVVYFGIFNCFIRQRSSRHKITLRAKLLLAFELIRCNSNIRKAKLVAKLFVLPLAYNLSPSVLP